MKKLYRSAMFAGVLAFGVAACGDDVQIVEGPPAPAPALQVSLTPSNQSINVGETADFAVGVSGGAEGAQASWTCSSSNTGVAGVATTDTGCRATGAAAGNASITVTVTKGNQSANAGAQVTVTAPPATTPATITIASINEGNTPADIDNIQGQINVVLNVDPKDDTIERVVLMVDGVEVASQTYASAVAAMGDDAAAEAVQQITLSFRTDFYSLDEEAGMGVPRHMNGDRTISAALEVAGTEADRPSNTVPVTFRNESGFHVTTDVTTKPSAMSAAGEIWYGGPEFGETEITAYPVLYDGGDIQSVSITFCGGSGNPFTEAPFTASRTCAGVTNAAAVPSITSIVDGNAGPTDILNDVARFGLSAHPFPVRIDRQGPGSPSFMANPRVRQNGWINADVDMVGAWASTNNTTRNRWLVNGTADAGVGGYIRQVRIAPTTGTVNTARAAEPTQNPELPAPSLNNNDYCVIATAVDLLGNESALPAAGTACTTPPVASETAVGANHLRFGVDIVAPTITLVDDDPAFLAHGERIAAADVGREFQMMVADTGTVGVSGMLAGAPVVATGSLFNASGTASITADIDLVATLPTVTTDYFVSHDEPGYVTVTFRAQDAAGNVSEVVTRSIVFDVAGNVPTFTQALFNTPLSGSTATFTALASDNLDLWKVQYEMTYAGGIPSPILFPEVVFNDFPPVPSALMNSNVSAGITVNGFMRQVENVTGTGPLAVGGAFKPTDLDGTVTDASGQTATASTAIAAGAVTDGTSYTAAAAAQLIDSWSITAPDGAETPEPGDAVTLTASAFGPTATFNAPFTRVDFYVNIGGNMVQIGSGTQGSTFDDGSAQGRRHQWTFSWTIPEELNGVDLTAGPLALDIYAIGVNANGDALMTEVNTDVTVTP